MVLGWVPKWSGQVLKESILDFTIYINWIVVFCLKWTIYFWSCDNMLFRKLMIRTF